MKTELEKKLNKLPNLIINNDVDYILNITKIENNFFNENVWNISYKDDIENCILEVEHTSLQAAVDTTLKELKNL